MNIRRQRRKLNIKILILNLSIFLGLVLSCGQKPSFVEQRMPTNLSSSPSTTSIIEEVSEGDATSVLQNINSEFKEDAIKKIAEKDYILNVLSVDKIIPAEKPPVEVVFVLDNSDSMSFNIEKLKNASGSLFEQLKESQIPYSARILTLDMLINQLTDITTPVEAKVPSGLFQGDSPNYNRQNSVYEQVVTYDNIDNVQSEFISKLEKIKNEVQNIDNEPGICLAMDYINWALNQPTPKLSFNKKWHFIMLSDENNAKKFDVYDPLSSIPKVLSSKDLVCYQNKKYQKQCETIPEKTQYCYSYQQNQTAYTYKYTGTYKIRGYCQKLGYVNDEEEDTLYTLKVNKRCVTNKYKCEKFWNVTKYSCTINALSTSAIYDKDYSQGIDKRLNCEIATNFKCKQYVDGREKLVDKTRDEALGLIAQGAICEPQSWQGREILLANDSKLNNPGIYGIRSCFEYSCTPIQVENTAIQEILESQQNSTMYRNCQLISTSADPRSLYTVTKDSQKRLISVSALSSCPTYYKVQDLTTPAVLDSTQFCGKNLQNISIPNGVIVEYVGLSKTQIKSYTLTNNSPLTKAQIASKLGVSESDIISMQEEVSTTTNIVSVNAGCFENQEYPEGHPFREGKLNFTEIVKTIPSQTNCKDVVIEDKKVTPTPDNFMALMRELYPKANITWHSIVNTTGSRCYTDASTQIVSKGDDYIALSAMSGGKVYDICADTYKEFVDKVADQIIKEVVTNYDLPKELQSKEIILVVNQSSNQVLEKDKDWWVSENTLVFDKNKVNPGDKIIIKYKDM